MQAIGFGLPQGARRIGRKILAKEKSSQPPRALETLTDRSTNVCCRSVTVRKKRIAYRWRCGLVRPGIVERIQAPDFCNSIGEIVSGYRMAIHDERQRRE